RIRGLTLMAMSNKFGWMVLTTGNKSEMAVGYFTIYGDSVGGYAVIKDVFKTRVYDLCRYYNRRAGAEIIPEAVIVKPPSAELRPDQRDDQSLPPYEVLDPILAMYVEDAPRPRSSPRATTRRWCVASPGWSTSTSTSAANARRE
ncbi:MAG TPA: NAD(+) synthase, partial [Ilumatobacteraceae bacterium]|nr:NAD(+) synthase [Ilumatobacteraceae bacterium]